MWWHNPERGFLYRGWRVNIVDQGTVLQECSARFPVLGCAKPDTMTVFSVNNPYVLWHECEHIDNIMAGGGFGAEKIKDGFFTALGLNDLLATVTGIFPAPNHCGEGTMVAWNGAELKVVQPSYGRMQVLPTLEEWNRQNPDNPMAK